MLDHKEIISAINKMTDYAKRPEITVETMVSYAPSTFRMNRIQNISFFLLSNRINQSRVERRMVSSVKSNQMKSNEIKLDQLE